MSKRRHCIMPPLLFCCSLGFGGTENGAGACLGIVPTGVRDMAKEPKQLDELFHDTLKDIYYAEKKILSALPKMAKAAQNADLRAAFEKHKTETEGQIDRLEQVFELIEEKAQGKKCAAIEGI